MVFPKRMLGRCPVCGDRAEDMDDPPDGWVSDSDDLHDTFSGYWLVKYKGEWMCPRCRRRLRNDDQTEKMIARDQREEEFRQNAGYTTNYDQ